MERVFLIHGWGVFSTRTYGALHLKIANARYRLEDISLAKYVTRDNDIEIHDIAKAMHLELERKLGPPPWEGPMHFITHSTGALVLKQWLMHFYKGKHCEGFPVRNVVFVAGPHFGSRLAHHAKNVVAQWFFYQGESGTRVLDSLELGSQFSWDQNLMFSQAYKQITNVRFYCLVGGLARSDYLSKTAAREDGSDEVVRIASANQNYRRFELRLAEDKFDLQHPKCSISDIPVAILPQYHHSGGDGNILSALTRPPHSRAIIESITKRADAGSITADSRLENDLAEIGFDTPGNPHSQSYLSLKLILMCLKVKSSQQYKRMGECFNWLTNSAGNENFSQVQFSFKDLEGRPIEDCYVGIEKYIGKSKKDDRDIVKPSSIIKHVHKHGKQPGQLTFYLKWDSIKESTNYLLRFSAFGDDQDYEDSVIKIPAELIYYEPSDPAKRQHRLLGLHARELIRPNETTQFDVVLDRTPRPQLFEFLVGTKLESDHWQWDTRGRKRKDKKIY